MDDLDLQTLVLDRIIKEGPGKTARANVGPGTYPVDFVAHITGSVKVAPDGKRDVKTQVDYKQAFTSLCWMLVRDGTINEQLIGDVIRDMMTIAEAPRDDIGTAVTEAEAEVTSVVREADRKGTVTTRLNVAYASAA